MRLCGVPFTPTVNGKIVPLGPVPVGTKKKEKQVEVFLSRACFHTGNPRQNFSKIAEDHFLVVLEQHAGNPYGAAP